MAANIQTTLGKPITVPAGADVTIYAPDGTPHHCTPLDAREILAGGSGYTSEPPVSLPKQTGEAIVDAAISEVAQKGVEREQQSEQQSIVGNSAAGDKTAATKATAADQPDDQGSADKPKRRKTGQK